MLKRFAKNPAVAAIEKEASHFMKRVKELEESAEKIVHGVTKAKFRKLAKEYRKKAGDLLEESKRLAGV
jgi:hypothetical protein